MSKKSVLTWYSIAEAVPASNINVFIRIVDDEKMIYRAQRVDLPGTRYGFLFILLNDFKLTLVADDYISEKNAFCPANIIEWCYTSY